MTMKLKKDLRLRVEVSKSKKGSEMNIFKPIPHKTAMSFLAVKIAVDFAFFCYLIHTIFNT